MSAQATPEEIAFVVADAQTWPDAYVARRVVLHLAGEVAALRRQVEERRVAVPPLPWPTGNRQEDDPVWGMSPDMEAICKSKGNPQLAAYQHGVWSGYDTARLRAIPAPPTPDADTVVVGREEHEALRELEHQAWSALDEVQNHGECDMTGIYDAYKMIQEARALRTGEVVATPPPDVVTVKREEWERLQKFERDTKEADSRVCSDCAHYRRSQSCPGCTHPESPQNDYAFDWNMAQRCPLYDLRSGEAPAQRGEG